MPAPAPLDSICLQARVILVILALVCDAGPFAAVPHYLVPCFASRHSHDCEECLAKRTKVGVDSEPLVVYVGAVMGKLDLGEEEDSQHGKDDHYHEEEGAHLDEGQ